MLLLIRRMEELETQKKSLKKVSLNEIKIMEINI